MNSIIIIQRNLKSYTNLTRKQGFTLIEVMITVVIVAILAAIAVPSYTQHIVRTNRSAAQSLMLTVANQEELFLPDAKAYFCTAPDTCTFVRVLGTPASVAANYNVTVDASDLADGRPLYTITATPISTQLARDVQCGTLTLDQDSQRTRSGSAPLTDCWK